MKQIEIHSLNTCERVVDFGTKHPLVPPIARATVLFGRVDTAATHLRELQTKQDDGHTTVFAGLDQRNALDTEVKDLMMPINEIARSLVPTEHPGVRQKFLMPRAGGFSAVISRARSFVQTLENADIKTLFTERGLAATFDTDLKTKVDALEAATSLKYEGLVQQVGGTAGLKVTARGGIAAVRELNGILRQRYKDDPELLEAWNAARHVQRPPSRKHGPVPAAAVNGDLSPSFHLDVPSALSVANGGTAGGAAGGSPMGANGGAVTH